MAQKKITDLTLRSSFDASCNIPVDDSSQTWRTTGAQLLTFIKAQISTPTVQKFTSGTGTYTLPANCKWIRVRLVGGGGGGAGSGTASQTNGSAGADTSFSSAGHTLTGPGGLGGNQGGGGNEGGVGGQGSFSGSGSVGVAIKGQGGTTGIYQGTGSLNTGFFAGGASPFGGNGHNSTQINGEPNSGSGGASGGISNFSGAYSGGGGGAGGYVDVIIKNPTATYAYDVGVGGANGAGGTNGSDGGDGGSGFIVVEEFYI